MTTTKQALDMIHEVEKNLAAKGWSNSYIAGRLNGVLAIAIAEGSSEAVHQLIKIINETK